MIAEFAQRPSDVATVEAHARRTFQRVVQCPTFDDFIDALASDRVTSAVVDLSMCPAVMSVPVPSPADRQPMLLHAIHALSQGETAALRAMAKLPFAVRSIYPRYHDLDACLSDRPYLYFPSCTTDMLALADGRLSADVLHLFTCCVVLGERRTTKGRVASESLVRAEDIDRHLRAAGLIPHIPLLQKVRMAHAVGRMQNGCSPAVAASLAGFESVKAMDNYFAEHDGVTRARCVKHRHFERMIEAILPA
jgi:hypothetical protein